MTCLYYWQSSLREWNYAYSIHTEMIQTEEVNAHAIISKKKLKEKMFYISFKSSASFKD